jgi:hypothetical protein
MKGRVTMGIAAKALGILVLAALCTGASAQLYKCTRPDGKIVYSDTRCEAAASGAALKVVPNSSTDPNAPAADKKDIAVKPLPGKGAESIIGVPVATPAPESAREAPSREPGALSYSDRERLRSLEMTVASSGATQEQKEAAQLEIRSIRGGRESRMSRDDRELRESLTVDLGSVDRKKRNEAIRQLRDIYYR